MTNLNAGKILESLGALFEIMRGESSVESKASHYLQNQNMESIHGDNLLSFGLHIILLLAFSIACMAAQLPVTLLNPVPPTPSGSTRTVCSSMCDFTDIQSAWNAAAGGDEIVITAGQTFTSASALLTLSSKISVTPILIRSSASCASTGNRAGSGQAANMPKLQVTGNNIAVIQNSGAAHNVYFLCLNITLGSAVTSNFALVSLGTSGTLSNAPSSITLDRCWIHSEHNAVGAQDFVRGVGLEGSSLAVINSTVEGFSSPNIQADSQAVLVFGGPGVGLLRNNYLDAASEIVMFGGTNAGLQSNQVTDWEISFNRFKKQVAWATAGTNAKNCFEFKTGVRMWAHDNLFEDCYSNVSQSGACVLLTNRPSQSGYGTTENNVTYQGNLCRHAGQAVQILGADDFCGQMTSTVNTAGTALTITGGTQGDIKWANLPVTINGSPFTVSSFSNATTGTLSTSAGTLTGATLQTVYANCGNQQLLNITNNLFDDISDSFNNAFTETANIFGFEQYTNFDHNTTVIGMNSSGPVISYFFENSFTPSLIAVALTNSISVTTQYGAFAAGAGNSPQVFLVPPNTSVYMNLTGNLPAGLTAPEPANWNIVGTGNQFPANYAAIGLLAGNKSLSPMSPYFSTGAGANLTACFDETAITNGTPAGTTCVPSAPSTSSSIITGQVTISGKATIQ